MLRQLPIPNKTMVKDSKVMSVVHRWASQLAEQGATGGAIASAVTKDSDIPPPPDKQAKVTSEEADSDASESSGWVLAWSCSLFGTLCGLSVDADINIKTVFRNLLC